MRKLLIVDDNVELAGLLAALVEEQGFEAQIAHTGKEAYAFLESDPPDAALVDLLLPDVRGNEVLKELARLKIPAIAISGVFKGDRFAREVVTLCGARAFFEKPFDAEALMAAITALVLPRPGEEPRPAPPLQELSLEDDVTDPAAPSLEAMMGMETSGLFTATPVPTVALSALGLQTPTPAPPPAVVTDAEALRREALDAEEDTIRLRKDEQDVVVDEPQIAPPSPVPEAPEEHPPEIAAALLEERPATTPAALPPETPAPTPSSLGPMAWSSREVWRPDTKNVRVVENPWPRSGDLAATSVARLLTAFYQGQQTGELRIRRGEVVKTIAVEKGIPVFAASNLGSERFAACAVRAGKLSAAGLEEAKKEAQSANMRTGDALVALGLLTEADRRLVLMQQVKEIIWSALDWSDGEYLFALGKHARKDLVKLAIFPGNLLLEGFRRSFPLVRLRALVPSDALYLPTQDPPYQLHDLKLSDGEALLLAYADGGKAVSDLLLLSDLEEREALAAVYGYVQLGILERRIAPLPSSTQRRIVMV